MNVNEKVLSSYFFLSKLAVGINGQSRTLHIVKLASRALKASAEGGLIGVSDVKEAIWVLSLLVHFGHQRIYITTLDVSKLTSASCFAKDLPPLRMYLPLTKK